MAQDQADPAEQAAPDFMAHDPYTVFRDANYRRFLLAGMAATIGNQMQSVAVGWELYERTRSPLALGMVGLAQVLPVLVLAIPSGHMADRYSRKAPDRAGAPPAPGDVGGPWPGCRQGEARSA